MMSRNICLASTSRQQRRRIGRALGARLGRRVVDTDAEVERWAAASLDLLRQQHGSATVADLRRQVIREVAKVADLVILLDTDAATDAANEQVLQLTSVVVALDDTQLLVRHAGLSVTEAETTQQAADAVLSWAMTQGDVLTPSEHEQVMP